MFRLKVIAALLVALVVSRSSLAATEQRETLIAAILSEDAAQQSALLQKLIGANDPMIAQTLTAWRGGTLYLFETNGTKVPFLLDSQIDSNGAARGVKVSDGSNLLDASGKPALFVATDLTVADTNSKLRKAIKTVLDLFALGNENPKMRRDAVTKLGQEQNAEYLPILKARLLSEKNPEVQKALKEAMAVTQIASDDAKVRIVAIDELGKMRSINGLSFLQNLKTDAAKNKERYGSDTYAAADRAIYQIERYMAWGNFFGTAFRGLSLAAVLLVAALGLAITFGLMGVINMAHGEIMAIGAYTAFVTQNIFLKWFGPSGAGTYFIPALAAAFVSAAAIGVILERSIIRFLYKRPLESLLATWGVSLVLQQTFRAVFGSANVQVNSPAWLSGSFVISDVLLAYNRLFVIAFALLILLGTYLLLTRTSLGLQIRAVMQNRSMASALGVRTDRVNMMTFGVGSGLAGMAGACLSQISNVGPSLGQNYIIDCFMVVVLGGVGNLVGTVTAAGGIGITDQILQPWLGAVMGKITVLGAIILFLQWRPSGLFAIRGRGLED
jgi:urea transport system permease protein